MTAVKIYSLQGPGFFPSAFFISLFAGYRVEEERGGQYLCTSGLALMKFFLTFVV